MTVRVEQSGYIPDWLDGSETANCYIVTEPGVYGFRAVKGNTSESVGTIASVEVLWESFGSDVAPKAGVLIEKPFPRLEGAVDVRSFSHFALF